MLNEDQVSLLGSLKLRPGASRSVIDQVLQNIGSRLPVDYLEIIERANGGEGSVGGNGFIRLWPIEEIPEVLAANEMERHAPGLLPFASDGGGNVYAFDLASSMRIVEVPLIGISRQDAKFRADSVTELLAHLADSSSQ
jgi:cell wall assembly regulator SMI1